MDAARKALKDEAKAFVQAQIERKKQEIREAILADLTPIQREVASSHERRIACLAGRRSGKSTLMASLIALYLLDAKRDDMVFYSALTKDQAKRNIWNKLVELNQKHKLGWQMSRHGGTVICTNGAQLGIIGISDEEECEKLRGSRMAAFFIDEPALYSKRLEKLIREVIGPALGDLGGSLYMMGTPGPVPHGYWWEVSTDQVIGWETYHWTVRSNAKFPRDVEEMLDEAKRDNDWTEDSVTFCIEYLAQWKLNTSQLVYAYNSTESSLPAGWTPDYITMGLDFGMVDSTAWTVLASKRSSRDVYVLYSQKTPNLTPEEAAPITQDLVRRFQPQQIVGDPAAKSYIEAYNRQYGQRGTYIRSAEKLGKLGAMTLMSGALASGRVKLLPDAGPLAKEYQELPWEDEKRITEHPGHPNDCADSALYAFRAHPVSPFAKPVPEEKTPEELEEEARERRRQKVKQMQSKPRW